MNLARKKEEKNKNKKERRILLFFKFQIIFNGFKYIFFATNLRKKDNFYVFFYAYFLTNLMEKGERKRRNILHFLFYFLRFIFWRI